VPSGSIRLLTISFHKTEPASSPKPGGNRLFGVNHACVRCQRKSALSLNSSQNASIQN
jgi:hypothetical protein